MVVFRAWVFTKDERREGARGGAGSIGKGRRPVNDEASAAIRRLSSHALVIEAFRE
jgi:hypothetical protein